MYKINPRIEGNSYELIEKFKKIETATIGHFTDFGYVKDIHLMCHEPMHIVGNALTVKIPHCDGSVIREALLLSKPGDVIVIDTSGDINRACWGGLRTIAAMTKKIAAVIVEGAVTDINTIRELGFPVFSRSVSPLTTRNLDMEGEVNGYVCIGGVSVKSGDLVVADNNGVFILDPKKASILAGKLLKKEEDDANKFLELYSNYKKKIEGA